LASPHALVGGRFRTFAGGSPKSLNYFLDNNSFTAQVFGLMFESLLGSDPLTGDHAPGLARSWAVSDDGKVFTFEIDPAARWSDGRPVTAEDVCWTFARLVDPQTLAGAHKMVLEPFEPPVALDGRRVRFTAKETHWRNLGAAGGFQVMPKHVYGALDFNKVNFDFPVVSGPYVLGTHRENVALTMERRSDWWGWSREANRNTLNFQTIEFRFFAERENAFESFRKGELDQFPIYTARLWVQEAQGERFDRNWIVKQSIRNQKPVGFQGFAMNLRRPPYDDVRVRRALAHLLDRDKLNRTLMFRSYFLHKSYFEDLYDAAHPCENPSYDFDKAKARALLSEAGWRANPATGWLEKDGKPLVVRFLNRDMTSDKFLTVYREDLRDVGIQLEVERKDVAAWFRDMDAFNFEMTWAAWGSGLFKDPESAWHSKEADRPSGNNITGFRDARVDALIERQKTEFDVAKRNGICREVDRILAESCPYVLLWNTASTRLLYWNRFGVPPTVLSRFGDEGGAISYWWFDPDSDADLRDAMRQGYALPQRPVDVDFDTVFRAIQP
jgi:microcin C transport system substrate-binding protein